MKIPFIDLKTQFEAVESDIRARIDTVLEHGQYIMGPEVKELELALQDYTKSKHCITVASGTEALLISLMALGIKPGDEIITTPFTFVSTAEVIALLGAIPVWVDIDPETCNIDENKIENVLSSKTKAIMPVSLYGQTPDMNKINAIAKNNGNIPVIEDAAQSFGASFEGKKSCNLSTIGCTSFFPAKPLGCYGDGGAIFTSDDEIAKICREIRVHGQGERYIYNRVGVGGRMDAIQAAIVLAKLDRFDWEIEKRQEVAKNYEELIKSSKTNIDIKHVSVKSNRTSVYAQYTLLVKDRDAIQTKLNKANIPSAIYYPIPLNEQEPYKNLCFNSTPISHSIAKQVISLPFSPDLKYEDQKLIIDKLIE